MLNIIVALKCEAKPLIQHYGLKHVPGNHPFPVYEKDGIILTISGPGKVASAAATAFIYTLLGQHSNSGWLNLGIAGHKSRSIGQGVLVHKITDNAANKNWYPSIVFTPQCESVNLITIDQKKDQYHENAIYEMEAAGFFEIASRFSTTELIHCYKVISDNQFNPVTNITEELVIELIFANLAEIDIILTEIRNLSATLKSLETVPPNYQEISNRWHFSVYQKGELRRLLKRWELVLCEPESNKTSLIPLLKKCKNSKGVLSLLGQIVEQKVEQVEQVEQKVIASIYD